MAAASSFKFDLLGIGNPIMDLLAHVPESFLPEAGGSKGGSMLVNEADIARLIQKLGDRVAIASGGSAANIVLSANRLGLRTTYVGKIGGDLAAKFYHFNFVSQGADGSRFKRTNLPNGRCLTLITPDGERTMRVNLGAAMALSPEEITASDFAEVRHIHIEGYLVFNLALAEKIAATARAAGCTISIDLASFEAVDMARDWLFEQLKKGVHIVFANEDEVKTLFQKEIAYDVSASELATYGGIAAVKVGKNGAWIAQGSNLQKIQPVHVDRVVDTTGAGDAWAAGFLHGHLRGMSHKTAGVIGSVLGAECVQHLGAGIPEARWPSLLKQIAGLNLG